MAITPDSSPLGRRQFLVTATAGALLGSAWGLALRETLGEHELSTVTVARTTGTFAALIEHQRRRILLADGALQNDIAELADLVTGIMRQRIDVLLATNEGIALLPNDFADRWRLDRVAELPQGGSVAERSLLGMELRLGDVTVTPARQVLGAWRYSTPNVPSPWFVTVSRGASQIIIAGAGAALNRLPIDPTAASCLVTIDEIDHLPAGTFADALATPADEDLANLREQRPDLVVVPIRTRTPLTLRMDASRIELPNDV